MATLGRPRVRVSCSVDAHVTDNSKFESLSDWPPPRPGTLGRPWLPGEACRQDDGNSPAAPWQPAAGEPLSPENRRA
eukprot:766525-Hanusia_phi.AAC.1